MIVITPKLVQASCSYFITFTTRKDSRVSGLISEHKTVNTPQKLMRGGMFN